MKEANIRFWIKVLSFSAVFIFFCHTTNIGYIFAQDEGGGGSNSEPGVSDSGDYDGENGDPSGTDPSYGGDMGNDFGDENGGLYGSDGKDYSTEGDFGNSDNGNFTNNDSEGMLPALPPDTLAEDTSGIAMPEPPDTLAEDISEANNNLDNNPVVSDFGGESRHLYENGSNNTVAGEINNGPVLVDARTGEDVTTSVAANPELPPAATETAAFQQEVKMWKDSSIQDLQEAYGDKAAEVALQTYSPVLERGDPTRGAAENAAMGEIVKWAEAEVASRQPAQQPESLVESVSSVNNKLNDDIALKAIEQQPLANQIDHQVIPLAVTTSNDTIGKFGEPAMNEMYDKARQYVQDQVQHSSSFGDAKMRIADEAARQNMNRPELTALAYALEDVGKEPLPAQSHLTNAEMENYAVENFSKFDKTAYEIEKRYNMPAENATKLTSSEGRAYFIRNYFDEFDNRNK